MAANGLLAPPVSFASGPTALLALLLALPWCGGAAVTALAWAGGGLSGSALAGPLLLLGLGAVVAARFWRGQEPRLLTWDGGQWLLAAPGVAPDARRHAVGVEVALDLQHALLVRSRPVAPTGRRRWLWLQRAGDGHRWHALRCALFAAPRHA